MDETPQLAKGAARAVFELYDVVTHNLLSSELGYVIKCLFHYQFLLLLVKSYTACWHKRLTKVSNFSVSKSTHGTSWQGQEMKDGCFQELDGQEILTL